MNVKRVHIKRKLSDPAVTKPGTVRKVVPEPGPNQALNQLFTIEEIQIRADEVTPLLKSILNNHPPAHWGKN